MGYEVRVRWNLVICKETVRMDLQNARPGGGEEHIRSDAVLLALAPERGLIDAENIGSLLK